MVRLPCLLSRIGLCLSLHQCRGATGNDRNMFLASNRLLERRLLKDTNLLDLIAAAEVVISDV